MLRRSGILNLLPRRLQELESMTPPVQPKFSSELINPVTPAVGPKKYRVAVLTGCAQDIIFSDVNLDTVEVLAHRQRLRSHHAARATLLRLASRAQRRMGTRPATRPQADRPVPARKIRRHHHQCHAAADVCTVKHYCQGLLEHDPVYHHRAELWDAKLKDIHEWLAQIRITPPDSAGAPEQVVTYHEACHLCHGQKITAQPRQVLRAIPNLKLVELPESTWCCGSAGIYNLIQPEMANELLDRKIKLSISKPRGLQRSRTPAIRAVCFKLLNGARNQNLPLRVVHPITLLAEVLTAGRPDALASLTA